MLLSISSEAMHKSFHETWDECWKHVATEPQRLGLPDVHSFGAHATQNYDRYWWLYNEMVGITLTFGIHGSENLICVQVMSLDQISHQVLFIHLKWMEPDCGIDFADVCAMWSVFIRVPRRYVMFTSREVSLVKQRHRHHFGMPQS